MIENSLAEIYSKFKLMFYKRIFSRFEQREATLTAVEVFCVEAIYSLCKPTILEFANFVKISQANATYKINSLEKKGYVVRKRSENDKREIHLEVTDKFMEYYSLSNGYFTQVVDRIRERFNSDEQKMLSSFLDIINNELMPEVTLDKAR